ncbi:Immunity protein 21 [Glycomyces harbinensis]|uniref:Immunity protein 21 n=2 Tax=Glycomyces harbinensis TaxID=58114 RepID=A0A1G7DXG0_9ACTN|nr:Immunity protein 21 [Glycomyces harbinensis]
MRGRLAWPSGGDAPAVLLHAASASAWRGPTGTEYRDDGGTWDDHDRASNVDDPLGLVAFGAEGVHEALVLGGEPLPSTYVPELAIVLRWWYARSEADLLAAVETRLPHVRWEPGVTWQIPPGGLVMIDAGFSWSDHFGPDALTHIAPLPIDLPAGRYRIETAGVEHRDPEATAVIHRFMPAPI